ncbi:MAG: glycosyltransferase family 4 protein [Verrucomicrobiae bacterium]
MKKNSLIENRALNVILTDCSPNWGGQQYRLLREALWLAARGHKVLVICGKRSQLGVRLREHSPQISLHLLNSWGGLHGLLEFFWAVWRWKPDIIHTRNWQDAFWGALAHVAGWTNVRSCHVTMPAHLSARRKFPFRSGCARVIAAAEFIKKHLVLVAGIPESRVDVVGEGVDLNEFHPGVDGRGFRSEFGIAEGVPVFGLVSMIRGEKGYNHFVNAAAKVLEKFPDARFVIAGDGEPARVEKLRAKILKMFPRQPSPVLLVGYRDDVPKVMAAIDVLVLPSKQEAQSLVIPQAFATGKPVIASNVGGIPENVRDGVNGFLVSPGDENGLAAAMEQLAASPDLRRRFGTAALELARRELSFDMKMDLLLASYRQALG